MLDALEMSVDIHKVNANLKLPILRHRAWGGGARIVRATAAAVGPGAVRGARGMALGRGRDVCVYIYMYMYIYIYRS